MRCGLLKGVMTGDYVRYECVGFEGSGVIWYVVVFFFFKREGGLCVLVRVGGLGFR